MTSTTNVELIRDGHVAELRLARADTSNRFSPDTESELVAALAELATDDSVRAVLWTAEGRHFSAGGDTAMMLAAHEDIRTSLRQIDGGRVLFRAFADFPKPLVAAVHGHAFGVATSLILLADAIVSTPGVRLVDPHVMMGLVAGDGGTVAWPANVPFVQAKRRLLWGEPVLAEEAYAWGVVTELVDTPEEVVPLARVLAERVAGLPPIAVQLTKRAFNKSFASRIDDNFDLAFYLEALSVTTADMREAVDAFTEKRSGHWQGR